MNKIRVLIAEDYAFFRRVLNELVGDEPNLEVVGEAANGQELLDDARRLSPDLILIDVSLPIINGVEATRLLTDEMPDLKVIVLTEDQEEYEAAAMSSGASACIRKELILGELPSVMKALTKAV